jgi:hypothetical protein
VALIEQALHVRDNLPGYEQFKVMSNVRTGYEQFKNNCFAEMCGAI